MYQLEYGDEGKGRFTYPQEVTVAQEVPVHGWANPQDLEPNNDIVDTIIAKSESGIRIVGMLGNFAAHHAIHGFERFVDKIRRD